MSRPPESKPPALGSLLGLAWPIVATRATQSVVGFCDALMVAPLGEETLAAVTTGALNSFAFIILPMGSAFIVQSFAAQLRGRGDLEGVSRYAWYGLILAACFAVLGLVAIPFVGPLLGLFAYAPAVLELMTAYLSIRLLSVGAAVGTEALSNWYGGLGNTRVGMVASLVTMVVNLAGNYLLIEPRFGLPGYGATGAAVASVVASWVGFFVVALAFARGHGYQRVVGRLHLRLREFTRVLRFGLPNGVNWFMEFSVFVLFINVVVAHLGTTALAAFNVVVQINSLSFMPAFGVSSAGAILVGEAIGRRAHHEVWPIVKLTGAVASAWMMSVGLVYLLAPEPLVSLFRSSAGDSEALIAVGATMLMLSALWQLADAANLVLSEALRAAGDTTYCMVARLVLGWLVFTPVAWAAVLVFDAGIGLMMTTMIVYLFAQAGVFALRFASGRWREIDMVGEPELV